MPQMAAALLSIHMRCWNHVCCCCVPAADPHQDMILADGISRLCDDLGVEPTDIVLVRISTMTELDNT
jgi:hypothetical protein